VKSAILLAGVAAGVAVSVTEPAPSRDHTERMLRRMGATVVRQGACVRLEPPSRLEPLDVAVPGDPSSAAFFVALAALADAGELALTELCLNETRTGFLRVLERMGARLDVDVSAEQGGEPVGSVRVRPSELSGIDVAGGDVPAMIDELPMLACAAARAHGITTIAGAAELRVKESDRVAAIAEGLSAMGADVDARDDGWFIRGGQRLEGARVGSRGDHRVAMALAVAGLLAGGVTEIEDAECVDISYPGFWDDVERMCR
jgi:3-phosphoshikimate 1-carboxyvinyltransferase